MGAAAGIVVVVDGVDDLRRVQMVTPSSGSSNLVLWGWPAEGSCSRDSATEGMSERQTEWRLFMFGADVGKCGV